MEAIGRPRSRRRAKKVVIDGIDKLQQGTKVNVRMAVLRLVVRDVSVDVASK